MSAVDIAKHQQELVSAIWSKNNLGFDARSLEIYRANLSANAIRSLSITYPTIKSLVGEMFFSAMVDKFIENHPLHHGDWGVWGHDFPEWLNQQQSLSSYPYLMDCAKLDWICHIVEREEANYTEVLKNELLPQQLESVRLQYATGSQIIRSDYPIADIWLAHHTTDPTFKTEFMESSRQKLLKKEGQNVLIWRPKWKSKVCAVSAVDADWIEFTMAGNRLTDALQFVANTDFSLIDWLPRAFSEQLVYGFKV